MMHSDEAHVHPKRRRCCTLQRRRRRTSSGSNSFSNSAQQVCFSSSKNRFHCLHPICNATGAADFASDILYRVSIENFDIVVFSAQLQEKKLELDELAILCLNRLKRVIQYYLPLKQYMVQLLPSHCQPQL
ncbi:unnamed protein product [Lactuca saligna]|uniref:Uncharacterized protein n=1 Tax=Lactuca saligna TaxID=75948 RepID=A0AA35V1W6_LACSI|nr:unnamed protein product [Lactuca saligna]